MAKFMGVKVSIIWEYIQVWRSIATDKYRLQSGVEPVSLGFTLEALEKCNTAHEMLNFMGAMGWENYQILPAPDGNVFNYFFKRPIIVEEGQPGPVRVKDSVMRDFDIMKFMGGD